MFPKQTLELIGRETDMNALELAEFDATYDLTAQKGLSCLSAGQRERFDELLKRANSTGLLGG